MSSPRLQDSLLALYEQKGLANLKACLEHSDFQAFQDQHGLCVPPGELSMAFTHTSFSHEFSSPHQEQLEFLGDAVLELILTEELCRLYPQEKEGRLSKLRSALVNEKILSALARYLGLGELLLVGRGEFMKRLFQQDAVLADTFEALLAQIYRHQGYEFTKGLFLGWLKGHLPGALDLTFLKDFDPKSKLQELSWARHKMLPKYVSEPRGEKFEVQLWVNDKLVASGTFLSKKSGERELAAQALKKGHSHS